VFGLDLLRETYGIEDDGQSFRLQPDLNDFARLAAVGARVDFIPWTMSNRLLTTSASYNKGGEVLSMWHHRIRTAYINNRMAS